LQHPKKQAKVKTLEREIDHFVYQLYGLTDKEIKIVEGETK
jgi:type II restriction/modification system DNA methylase subunit YeeA